MNHMRTIQYARILFPPSFICYQRRTTSKIFFSHHMHILWLIVDHLRRQWRNQVKISEEANFGQSPNRGLEAPKIWGRSPNRGRSPRQSGGGVWGGSSVSPSAENFWKFKLETLQSILHNLTQNAPFPGCASVRRCMISYRRHSIIIGQDLQELLRKFLTNIKLL